MNRPVQLIHHPKTTDSHIRVSGADRAERELLGLSAARVPAGARLASGFADPAGHPFCIVFGRPGAS
jgi:hypothetical protein